MGQVTLQTKIITALAAGIMLLAGVFYWYVGHRDDELMAANNELAKLIPLQHVNDSLAFRIAAMVPAEDIQDHLDKESQLAKMIAEKDQRILFLVNATTRTRIDSFPVPIVRTVRRDGTFATGDYWFDVSGWLDSMNVHFDRFEVRDSITLAITQAREGILYGYIANHSPYNRIMNADFTIDSKQYFTPPWFKFNGFGIVGGAGSPGLNYLGVDVKATFWNALELSPRFTVNNGVFTKSIEGRWRLPLF